MGWRRVRDSNPRYVAVYLISSQAPSTTRPTLRESRIIADPRKDTATVYFVAGAFAAAAGAATGAEGSCGWTTMPLAFCSAM